MTPHTPSAFVDVRSDAVSLQPVLMSPCALLDAKIHTHCDCPTHTCSDSPSDPSKSPHMLLSSLHISSLYLFYLLPGFFSLLLYDFFQADEDEVRLNINHSM